MLYFDEMLALMLEFVNRFVNVGQGFVPAFLDKASVDFGLPAQRQIFKRVDIQVTVMKEGFQPGHILDYDTAVLPSGIATPGRLAGRPMLCQTRQQPLSNQSLIQPTRLKPAHTTTQPSTE